MIRRQNDWYANNVTSSSNKRSGIESRKNATNSKEHKRIMTLFASIIGRSDILPQKSKISPKSGCQMCGLSNHWCHYPRATQSSTAIALQRRHSSSSWKKRSLLCAMKVSVTQNTNTVSGHIHVQISKNPVSCNVAGKVGCSLLVATHDSLFMCIMISGSLAGLPPRCRGPMAPRRRRIRFCKKCQLRRRKSCLM